MTRYQQRIKRRRLMATVNASISFLASLTFLSFGLLAVAYTGSIEGGIFAAIACISAITATVSGFAARA